jgi:hypothetical protein
MARDSEQEVRAKWRTQAAENAAPEEWEWARLSVELEEGRPDEPAAEKAREPEPP